MALLTSELTQIKAELGFNVLNNGAEPYIGVSAIFEQVIATYLTAGATTTSATAVTAVSAGAAASPVTLVLTSATGVTVGDRLIVDVDDRQEEATLQSLSGSSATLLLSKTHSGTYPVTVEGGETIVRGLLRQLRTLGNAGGTIESAFQSGGIKKVDDVEFFGNNGSAVGAGTSRLAELKSAREYLRRELADALGVTYLRAARRGASQGSSLY